MCVYLHNLSLFKASQPLWRAHLSVTFGSLSTTYLLQPVTPPQPGFLQPQALQLHHAGPPPGRLPLTWWGFGVTCHLLYTYNPYWGAAFSPTCPCLCGSASPSPCGSRRLLHFPTPCQSPTSQGKGLRPMVSLFQEAQGEGSNSSLEYPLPETSSTPSVTSSC